MHSVPESLPDLSRPPVSNIVNRFYEAAYKKSDEANIFYEVSQEVALITLAGIGCINYLASAKEYAESDNAIVLSSNPIYSQLAVCIPAAMILYNATSIFIKWAQQENVPTDLKRYCVNENKIISYIKNIALFIGSAASAVPLAATYILYQSDEPLAQVVSLTIMIEIANTLMHFLPFKLMLNKPLYRLPVLPLEYAIKKGIAYYRGKSHEEEMLFKKRVLRVQHLLQTLGNRLHERSDRAIDASLYPQFFDYLTIPAYEIESAKQEHGLDPLLSKEIEAIDTLPTPIMKRDPEKRSWYAYESDLNRLEKKFPHWHNVAFCLGALWLVSGCVTYAMTPYRFFKDKVGSPDAAMIAALPAYAFFVLVIFMGGEMMVSNVATVMDMKSGKDVLPLSAKLYPKTFFAMQLITIFSSLFSYTSTAELVEDNFEKEHTLHDVFLWAGISSMTYLTLNTGKDFAVNLLEKYATHWGSSEKKSIMRFKNDTTKAAAWINAIDPDIAYTWIHNLSEDEAQLYFGLSEAELKTQLEVELEEKPQLSTWQNIQRFFLPSHWQRLEDQDEETALQNNKNPNYFTAPTVDPTSPRGTMNA